MTVKKHFPKDLIIIPITYSIHNINKDNWFKTDLGKEKVLGELKRIKEYLKKGDIIDL